MDPEHARASWEAVVAAVPAAWLERRRWYQHKGLAVDRLRLVDGLDLTPFAPPPAGACVLLLVDVELATTEIHRYQLLLHVGPRETLEAETDRFPVGDNRWATEALGVPAVHTAVRRLLQAGKRLPGLAGEFVFETLPVGRLRQVRPLAETSTNSLVLVKEDVVLKYVRRLEAGPSPELEMGRFFAARRGFEQVPPLVGAAAYQPRNGARSTLLLAHLYVENQGDLWSWSQEYLDGVLDGLGSEPATDPATIAPALDSVNRRLAEMLGTMHRVLAEGEEDFAPRPVTRGDLREWQRGMRSLAEKVFDRLDPERAADPTAVNRLRRLRSWRQPVLDAFGELAELRPEGWLRTRIHGDFHLAQVLLAGDDLVIIDFEGEPLRRRDERVALQSPLKDVAGLFRSYNYAIFAALFRRMADRPPNEAELSPLQNLLLARVRHLEEAFLEVYYPLSSQLRSPGLDRLLTLLKLEKGVYELDYEAGNRPDWLAIPLAGIRSCLEELGRELPPA